MKQYPYIAKMLSDDSKLALFTGPKTATALTDGFSDIKIGESDPKWHEDFYTNITHEYLSNTWGVIESKEHAEFIIELTSAAGFFITSSYYESNSFFLVTDESLFFCNAEQYAERERKLITIPLPPKAKDWTPEVGDTVTWGNKVCNGVVKAVDGNLAWIKNDQANYVTEYIDNLVKPKSNQELLIEELQTKLCNNNAVDNYILACDIINGEIEGLSYE